MQVIGDGMDAKVLGIGMDAVGTNESVGQGCCKAMVGMRTRGGKIGAIAGIVFT